MNLTEEQLQVILTGTFGDGSIQVNHNGTARYSTCCKHEDYLKYKQKLLGDLSGDIYYTSKNGYSQTPIYSLNGKTHKDVFTVHKKSLVEKLKLLTDLGIALWFYDDGSLHKKNKFYNLNTHSFSKEDNQIISDFLNERLGIISSVTSETKKDGRKFYYIFVTATGGSHIISDLLSKYPVECYSYKAWDKAHREQYQTYYDEAVSSGCKTTMEIKEKITRIKLSKKRPRDKEPLKYIKN